MNEWTNKANRAFEAWWLNVVFSFFLGKQCVYNAISRTQSIHTDGIENRKKNAHAHAHTLTLTLTLDTNTKNGLKWWTIVRWREDERAFKRICICCCESCKMNVSERYRFRTKQIICLFMGWLFFFRFFFCAVLAFCSVGWHPRRIFTIIFYILKQKLKVLFSRFTFIICIQEFKIAKMRERERGGERVSGAYANVHLYKLFQNSVCIVDAIFFRHFPLFGGLTLWRIPVFSVVVVDERVCLCVCDSCHFFRFIILWEWFGSFSGWMKSDSSDVIWIGDNRDKTRSAL